MSLQGSDSTSVSPSTEATRLRLWRTILAAATLAGAALATACSSTLPSPPTRPQPDSAFVQVPYPPPPARPERTTDQPTPGTVWIDGEWRWSGARWVWIYGRWVRPPEGARLARWKTRRRPSGQLEHAPSRWYSSEGEPLPPPEDVKLADADEGDRVEDVGVVVDVGRNREPGELRNGTDDDEKRASDCDLDCRLDPLDAPPDRASED